jgi:hypothetical protein
MILRTDAVHEGSEVHPHTPANFARSTTIRYHCPSMSQKTSTGVWTTTTTTGIGGNPEIDF